MTLIASLVLAAGLPWAVAGSPRMLTPGVPLTGSLSAGAAETFEVDLEAGALLEALVEQQGVDVAIDVTANGADPVRNIDYRNEPTRTERVLWIAGASGPQGLTVRAATGRPGGRYRILVASPHPATDDDRRRVSAQRSLEQAVALWRGVNKEDTADARARALGSLESSLADFRATGDRRGQAEVLEELANLHGSFNRHARSLSSAEAALPLFQGLGDEAAELAMLGRIGWARFAQGDVAGGLARLEEVLQRARESRNEWRQAICLNDIGTIRRRSGQLEQAVELHTQAAACSRASGNLRIEAFSLNNLGIAYKDLGEYERALGALAAALALFREMKDEAQAARALNNMGNVHLALGDDQQALEVFRQVLESSRLHDTGGDTEAAALNNMATLLHRRGEDEEAIAHSRQALEIRKRYGDLSGQSFALHNIGQALGGLGRHEEALGSLQEALRLRRALGERAREAETLMAVAVVERDRGRLAEALASAELSISLTEAAREAITHPDLRTSFVATQQDAYAVYIDILMRLHEADPSRGHDAAALQGSERARARALLDALIEARADVRQGVDAELLARERAVQLALVEASGRASAAAGGSSAEDAERAGAALASRIAELRDVQSQIRESSPRYARLMQPRPATLDDIRRHLLDEETVLLEFYLGPERSVLWAATSTELVSRVLPDNARIESAARALHEVLTERQRRMESPVIAAADSRLDVESRRLSGLLLDGIADRLLEWRGKRLVVVASGALAYVPFALLSSPATPARPLGLDHEIVYAPSASVLVALRQERREPYTPPTRVAVLADPVFEASDPRVRSAGMAVGRPLATAGLRRAAQSLGHGGFARLPFSRREGDGIAALVPRDGLARAVDFRAARELVTGGGLGDRQVIHLATHGLLDSQHPDLSGLVLSLVDENGRPVDGFLRMHEIYNLQLSADLVVLSACQTALGKEVRGEGLIGLTRGFMYAGARSVVASLWQVDDESTAELMRQFYRGMLKEKRRPADALRAAQLEMSRDKRWSAPFYWAGFVLQGEWR